MRSTKNILLALDTSTRTAGLALFDGSEILVEFIWTSQDHHTTELAPFVNEAFQKSRITPADLAAVSVARGPGSFTGLRIGLALAKGIAIARRIPIISIPTLDILAAGQPPADLPMVAVLRAGRGRLAACWYLHKDSGWMSTGEIEVLNQAELMQRIKSSTLVCGELSAEERESLSRDCPDAVLATPSRCLRRPAVQAEMAWALWKHGMVDEPAALSPLYLHYNQPLPE